MAPLPSPPPSPKMEPPNHAVASGRIAKTQRKEKTKVVAVGGFTSAEKSSSRDAQEKPFPFLALPGELRNKIYTYCIRHSQQALITHLPRRASLRPRKPPADPARQAHRHHVGLTQVCRQIRNEFRPMYLITQEIGLDFTQISAYISTFYPGDVAPDSRVGNLTIALSGKITPAERNSKGIDVNCMLDMWANSYRMEAGFGRYYSATYNALRDGEAKDLYRLFGRRVMLDRRCSSMNKQWREVLKERKLAEVRVHRYRTATKMPFIHVIYKPDHKEHWMKSEVSDVNDSTRDSEGKPCIGWLERMGFLRMEFFTVKVGVKEGGDAFTDALARARARRQQKQPVRITIDD